MALPNGNTNLSNFTFKGEILQIYNYLQLPWINQYLSQIEQYTLYETNFKPSNMCINKTSPDV